jgi:hypothetical protein
MATRTLMTCMTVAAVLLLTACSYVAVRPESADYQDIKAGDGVKLGFCMVNTDGSSDCD